MQAVTLAGDKQKISVVNPTTATLLLKSHAIRGLLDGLEGGGGAIFVVPSSAPRLFFLQPCANARSGENKPWAISLGAVH